MTDYQKYLVDEYLEDYEKGEISRRQAMKMLAAVTGSAVLANGLLAACARSATPTMVPAPPTAVAAAVATSVPTAAVTGEAPPVPDGVLVAEDDPEIAAGPIDFPGEGATLSGYLAVRQGSGPFPAVLVCHENRGLTPYAQNVARRLAKAGYVALAVDLLAREGGTAKLTAEQIPEVLGNTPGERFVGDFLSGWEYVKGQPFTNADSVGMVGFCFGGGVTWSVATKFPELKAAVPFYGPPPPVEELTTIQAAVLAVYAGDDERITSTVPEIEAAMAAAGKVYEKAIFPGVGHAFHNDTGQRYNPEAAEAAWTQALGWFDKYLRGA